MNLSGLKKMMNMNKGWAFVSNPNGMMKKGSGNWVETIKFAVMSRLGISHQSPNGMIKKKKSSAELAEFMSRFNKACADPVTLNDGEGIPKEWLGIILPRNKRNKD